MRYKTILVDPPWDNADSITPKNSFAEYQGGWPYETMLLKDIAALPIKELADQDAHLYIWTMNSFVPHACWLMQHWGFKYSQLITWVKPSGMGHWWINRTQHMVFGYRNKYRMRNKMLPNVFGAHPVRHSEKPDVSYELIEEASFGPYVELFARRVRPGWHTWGNEVQSDREVMEVLTHEREIEESNGAAAHVAAGGAGPVASGKKPDTDGGIHRTGQMANRKANRGSGKAHRG